MTIVRKHRGYHETDLQITARRLASFMPVLIIGYSALIDPLFNFDPTPRVFFGGIQIGATDKSTIATKVVIPVLFLTTLLLAMIAPLKYPRSLNPILLSITAYFGLAMVSGFWSRDPSNTVTLALYQIILCGSLFLAIGVSNDPAKIMGNLLWLFLFVVLVNLAFTAVQPPGPIGHQGIYSYKNTLGSAAGCALIIAAFQIVSVAGFMRAVALTTFTGAVFLLILSDSKTGIVMAAVAPIIAICWLTISRAFKVGLFVSAFVISIAVLAAYIIFSNIFFFEFSDLSILLFGDDTFTGRTHVWDFAISHVKESPLYGQGYRGFWGIGAESPSNRSEIEFIRIAGSSHNGYLDALLDLGVVGLSIKVIFVLSVFAVCSRMPRERQFDSRILLSIAIFVAGRNMMESVIFWSTIFDNLLIVSVGFLACLNSKSSNRRDLLAKIELRPHQAMQN